MMIVVLVVLIAIMMIFQLCRNVSQMIMIPRNDIPRNSCQRFLMVDLFKGRLKPLIVFICTNPMRIEIVSQRQHEGRGGGMMIMMMIFVIDFVNLALMVIADVIVAAMMLMMMMRKMTRRRRRHRHHTHSIRCSHLRICFVRPKFSATPIANG